MELFYSTDLGRRRQSPGDHLYPGHGRWIPAARLPVDGKIAFCHLCLPTAFLSSRVQHGVTTCVDAVVTCAAG